MGIGTEEGVGGRIPADTGGISDGMTGASVKTYSVVSMFSGCGGMDLGFLGDFHFGGRHYDRLPFEITWANDVSVPACETYEHNLKHPIIRGDVIEALETLPELADVIIGGFPCQDVSINGSRLGAEGKRTILYRQMIEAVRRVKPRIFVAENVKGLRQAHGREMFETMIAEFRDTGYEVSHSLYLAADYDVPQMRERVFIIGTRAKRRVFHRPEPALRTMTAHQALNDLEDLPEDPDINHIWSKAARSPEQGNRILKANAPATTIRAEHHGNIQWHYRLPRRISLREAARLQSFPDEFRFLSGMRETERQIGNAVPPALAWHIAKSVREYLDA